MSASDQHHLQGHNVDQVDQLSSLVLMALALAGGVVAVVVLTFLP
ncbi:hypothetical protein OPKNFCMD_6150 [Methylobacterium crusticola]|uniref:Uncharacterized protein n=1 Tax=Methylobacterium crusticola TaxID=1697972 RepID=A0ABQ4R889_9HYPH|nr:hypothetical protein [Methylobacterium crusticola]GJD53375.1 hypothetical protein OPKNFCMD_6150 [Methylobacterium crusticola]